MAGCVDSRATALAETKKLGVVDEDHCFTSLEAALDRVAAAAVLVTTDLPSHIPMVNQALEAGKHVLVEKPFAPSVAEAREAVDLAESLGLTLMVSQNYRFFPAPRAVQQLMREETLGKLLHIEVDFRRHSPPSGKPVTGHRNWDQPLLVDMSVHHFDLLRALIGVEPTSVYCRTHNPGWAGFKDPPEASATIDFGDDLTVNYRGSWTHPGRKRSGPVNGEWSSKKVNSGGRAGTTSRPTLTTRPGFTITMRSAVRSPCRTCNGLIAPVPSKPLSPPSRTGCSRRAPGRENLGSLAVVHAAVESSLKREVVCVRA